MSNLMNTLRNPKLADQLLERLERDDVRDALAADGLPGDPLKSAVERMARGHEANLSASQEAIIRKFARPVLYIQDGAIHVPDALPLWQDRLREHRAQLERVLPSVGRIELDGHPRLTWAGTGWLIAPRVVVTNRHVAVTFAHQRAGAFELNADPVGEPLAARVDLCREHEREHVRAYRVKEVLHIEPEGGPDVALLRVASVDDDDRALPAPIPLADADPETDQVVAAIGYAGWDGTRNAQSVMNRIFEGVYDVKRLHPGEIMRVEPDYANHDCSTLGGNSGSAVVDLSTGRAVALHYAGQYLLRNYAVKATTLRQILDRQGIDTAVGS